jgi:hypothetical protein
MSLVDVAMKQPLNAKGLSVKRSARSQVFPRFRGSARDLVGSGTLEEVVVIHLRIVKMVSVNHRSHAESGLVSNVKPKCQVVRMPHNQWTNGRTAKGQK